MRNNTIKLYRRIKARYTKLYDEQRLRHDDVIEQLKDEFCKEYLTIHRAISCSLPESSVTNPLQTQLFCEESTA